MCHEKHSYETFRLFESALGLAAARRISSDFKCRKHGSGVIFMFCLDDFFVPVGLFELTTDSLRKE